MNCTLPFLLCNFKLDGIIKGVGMKILSTIFKAVIVLCLAIGVAHAGGHGGKSEGKPHHSSEGYPPLPPG